MVDWTAAQTISNIVLVLVLSIVTAYYARQNAKLMEATIRWQLIEQFGDMDQIERLIDALQDPKKMREFLAMPRKPKS